jgi:hypothetical protein
LVVCGDLTTVRLRDPQSRQYPLDLLDDHPSRRSQGKRGIKGIVGLRGTLSINERGGKMEK